MILNSDQSFTAKCAELKKLPKDISAAPQDIINRLFFAARNGAISHLLREFEGHFRDRGLDVRAQWKESSMGSPCITLTLHDKRKGEHVRYLWLNRTDEVSSSSLPSTLVYELKSIQAGEYYPRRKPQVAIDFDDVLQTAEFEALARTWVNGANYPFAYESHSSF